MKINVSKALKVGSLVISGAGLLVGYFVDKQDRSEMKREITEEILKELSKDKN